MFNILFFKPKDYWTIESCITSVIFLFNSPNTRVFEPEDLELYWLCCFFYYHKGIWTIGSCITLFMCFLFLFLYTGGLNYTILYYIAYVLFIFSVFIHKEDWSIDSCITLVLFFCFIFNHMIFHCIGYVLFFFS
jgi:hypothetical protein